MQWCVAARPLLQFFSQSNRKIFCSVHTNSKVLWLQKRIIPAARVVKIPGDINPFPNCARNKARDSQHLARFYSSSLVSDHVPENLDSANGKPTELDARTSSEGTDAVLDDEDEARRRQVARQEWSFVSRPVPEAILRTYGTAIATEKIMILHGPRGSGKHSVISGLLPEWKELPHVTALVDLEASRGPSSDSATSTSWLPLDWHYLRLEADAPYDEQRKRQTEGLESKAESRLDTERGFEILSEAARVQGSENGMSEQVSSSEGSGTTDEGKGTRFAGFSDSLYNLRNVKENLEGGLEYLAIEAVRSGCMNAADIFLYFAETHAFEGALLHLLKSRAVDLRKVDKIKGPRRLLELWKLGVLSVAESGVLSPTTDEKDWYKNLLSSNVEAISKPDILKLKKSHKESLNPRPSQVLKPSHDREPSNPAPYSKRVSHYRKVNPYIPAIIQGGPGTSLDTTKWRLPGLDTWQFPRHGPKEAILSLALAKLVLGVQEQWRARGKLRGERRGGGVVVGGVGVWGGAAEGAVAWAALLVELVSCAVRQGRFQPKLVINGMGVMRKAVSAIPGNTTPGSRTPGSLEAIDGSAFHDAFLLRILKFRTFSLCLPTILVSSDSHYSQQVYSDFGTRSAFQSFEMFGWSPEEAAIYLVPHAFDELQWNVVSLAVGGNPRHLAELHSLWKEHQLVRRDVDNLTAVDDCLDEYLSFLSLYVVDPAMAAAQTLVEAFAAKVASGKLPPSATRWGMAWNRPPQKGTNLEERRRIWARLQMVDFLEAFAGAEFGVNYAKEPALELLADPSYQALQQVGLLYQQSDPLYIRPPSVAFERCLDRWLVREKQSWGPAERLKYRWHRLIRGRSYRHLMEA